VQIAIPEGNRECKNADLKSEIVPASGTDAAIYLQREFQHILVL
jgi:hypothetical protein